MAPGLPRSFWGGFFSVTAETKDLVQRLQIDCKTVRFEGPPAAEPDPRKFRYFLNEGTILVVLDRSAEALQSLGNAERIFADNAFLHYVKGIAFGTLGYPKDSERELLTSIKLGSTDDAPAALARMYDADGRYEEEEQILKSAAEQSARPHWC